MHSWIRCLPGAALLACVALPALAADWYTGAEPAPDGWIVAVDASATVSSQGSRYGSVTVTGAADGSLRESGPRLRVEGLAGQFNDRSGTGAAIRGDQVEGSGLAGYELVTPDASLAGYLGLNLRSTALSRPDPGNGVAGTTAGLKAVLEAYLRPTDTTVIQAYGSYSTANNAYYARLRGGVTVFGQAVIGPEVAILGDDAFRQWRVGAHLTALQIGDVQIGVSAGYLRDATRKDGVYTGVDMRAGF